MRALVVSAVLLAGTSTSAAWVGNHDDDLVAGAPARLAPRLVTARDVATRLPGWRGVRDVDTGVVAQVWGGTIAVPGANADPAIAERAARTFLTANMELLAPGARARDFVVVANRVDDSKRTVAFEQTWLGVPVVGAAIYVVFARDRLFAAGSTAIPFVATALGPRSLDRGAPPALTTRAEAWIATDIGRSARTTNHGARVVLPIVRTNGIAYHLTDRIEITATGAPGWWDVYVDLTGAPILRTSKLRFATGTLAYDAGVRRPTGPRMAYPAPLANIVADTIATTTDANGGFVWAGAGNATVQPGLTGTRVNIIDQAGAPATATLTAQPSQTVTWSLASDPLGDAQLAAFIHAGLGKERARSIVPSIAPWIDGVLDVYVNESTTCNALSTGDDIHFYRGDGATCENSGRVADVVYHELGHSVHFQSIISGAGAFNGSLSEGLADYFAANIVDDATLGEGFHLDGSPVREVDPIGYEKLYPDDIVPNPHQSGLVIAGALWDLRVALIAELGSVAGIAAADRIFAGVLQRAPNIATSYVPALVGDDDNGNLGDGTPNECAIQRAFGTHGLTPPEVQMTTIGAPIVDELAISVPVTVPTGAVCPPLQVTGMRIAWEGAGGATGTVDLAPNAGVWTGRVPAQPAYTKVRYTITVLFDDQSTLVFPRNLADPAYELFVGDVAEIWCARFDEDPQWTVMQTGTPTPWHWDIPRGLNGDPAAAFTGTHVLGSDLIEDGRYAAVSRTSITTPPIDTSSYAHARLHYRRWLTVEDALYDQATIGVNGTEVWRNTSSTGLLTHSDREWRFHDLDLDAHAGAPIAISWGILADASRALGGWTLDDVCIVGYDKVPRCGDGFLDDGEGCDDGNAAVGDGCAESCLLEPVVEDNGFCAAGGDRGGLVLVGLGVLSIVRRRRFGRPLIDDDATRALVAQLPPRARKR